MRFLWCGVFLFSFLLLAAHSAVAERVSLGRAFYCYAAPPSFKTRLLKKSGKKFTQQKFKIIQRGLKAEAARQRGSKKRATNQLLDKIKRCRKSMASLIGPLPPQPTPVAPPLDLCRDKELLWNVQWDVSERNKPPFDLSAMPHMQSNIVILPGPWFGAFPSISTASQDEIGRLTWLQIPHEIRGGIAYGNTGTPLYADTAVHRAAMRSHISTFVPDVNFDGYIILDQEVWFSPWDFNELKYREEAKRQFRLINPSVPESQVTERTKQLWQSRSVDLYIATVLELKQIRPRAKIGLYDLMLRIYWDGYAGSRGDYLRELNDLSLPVHRLTDVIVADIYQFYRSALASNGTPLPLPNPYAAPPNGTTYFEKNRQYVEENIIEAKRIAALSGNKPVMAYTWMRYHDSGSVNDRFYLVNPADLFVQTIYPLMLGVEMVAIWGNEHTLYDSLPHGALQPYINTVIAPMLEGYCRGDLGQFAPLMQSVQSTMGG